MGIGPAVDVKRGARGNGDRGGIGESVVGAERERAGVDVGRAGVGVASAEDEGAGAGFVERAGACGDTVVSKGGGGVGLEGAAGGAESDAAVGVERQAGGVLERASVQVDLAGSGGAGGSAKISSRTKWRPCPDLCWSRLSRCWCQRV